MTVRCEVIPAVDVLGDESVRLVRGAFADVSTRAGDPAVLAASFAAAGARTVHVVDLDGARTGRLRPELIARIADAAAPASVQASGGIRSVAEDGQPVAGFAAELANLYLLVSHSGATLAPILGKLVAAELRGTPQAKLAPYRPDRFRGAA